MAVFTFVSDPSYPGDSDGWSIDLISSTIIPIPIIADQQVSSTTNFDPLAGNPSTAQMVVAGYELFGSFVISRTGTSTPIGGGMWQADYLETFNEAASTVTSVQAGIALAGQDRFSIQFDGPKSYAAVHGKTFGQLIADGDVIIGSGANDRISTTNASETIHGGAGNDIIEGRGGDDTIEGGSGDDVLSGGDGIDILRGGFGNDTYVIGTSRIDRIEDSGGIDTTVASDTCSLASGIEHLTLLGSARISGFGNTLDNKITGNSGRNTLDGWVGNDTLIGGAGNDFFVGGPGKDLMTGGQGNDTFYYRNKSHSRGSTMDVILDFDDPGKGNDRIELSALFGPRLKYIHDARFTDNGQLRIRDVAGPDVIVEVNLTGSLASDFSIRLKGTTLASMTASDFVL